VTVFLVGAGPGDPGLLTRRAAQLLGSADVVVHDRLVHPSVLALVPNSAEVIDVGKRPSAEGGQPQQDEINQLLIDHARQGRSVVRLKGGDPFVFGRGGEEVDALTAAGIPWEVVPGVSSAFSVPAAAGIPVTHRGLASSVTVVTGRVGDATDGVDWPALARVGGTLVILMGMANRAEIAEALISAGKPPETPVAVIARGTTASQRVERTTVRGLPDVDLGSPSVIVVGPVAALGEAGSPGVSGPLAGRTVVVTRSGPRAQGLSDALRRSGARTIEMPLTAPRGPSDGGAALRAAAAEVASYRWVILTSVNAVDRFMGELRDARALGSTLVAAVGPATGDALRMAGVEPDLVPAEHWARGVIEEFPTWVPDDGSRRILFPAADQAPTTLQEGLGLKGWEVDRVEAYRTVNLEVAEPALLTQVAQADAVTFTASSAIRAYQALRTPDGHAVPVPPYVVCIGPTTAETARALGLSGVDVAWGASTQGMVDVLVDHFAGPQRIGS